MQAPVVKKYPAKLTLTSFTCFFGLIQFLIIAAFTENDFEKWKIQSSEELFTILYAVIPLTSNLFDLCPISINNSIKHLRHKLFPYQNVK